MADLTQLLVAAAGGDRQASDELLPLVYAELRRLAAQRLSHEHSGHTLQATALVHEAYVRLVSANDEPAWNSRGHFFGAAAEAMQRILVESARRRNSLKRGGDWVRRDAADIDLGQIQWRANEPREDLLALDDALGKLCTANPQAARLVQLRYFAGLSLAESAEALEISSRTAVRVWQYARAWLRTEIAGAADGIQNP